MKLVVGLGNPGRRYANTRHNLGYWVVDALAERWATQVSQQKFNGLVGRAGHNGQEVLLLKPTTFMNRSGEAVLAAQQFYKLPLDDLLVVLDDLALPVGRLRIRASGSDGGHKGLADILRRLGSHEVARMRIGIGPAQTGETVGYVLGRARPEEESLLKRTVETAAEAVMCWIREGVDNAMNKYNSSPNPA